MLSIWIIHRDPRDRAAIARISGVDERAVLASPTDRVLDGAEPPTVVVLGVSGDFELELDFVHRHAAKLAHCSWILLPAARDIDEATRLFDTLPAEVLAYPPDPRALRRALRAAIQHRHADPLSARQGRAEIRSRFTRWFGDLELPELMRALDPRLARVPLLIHGEEGTGRGLLARYVHVFAGRAEHDLVQVICRRDSRAEDLLRQLAMGTGRGEVQSFYFEDVDRLPTAVQRTVRDWIEFGLPEGTLRRHGHRFMASASSAGDFDLEPGLDPRLGETLSGLTITLPPLRERVAQVPVFAQQTAEAFASAHGERVRHFGEGALAKLCAYPWPGNLHELEAVVTRTLSFTSADPIEAIHLRFPSDVHWLGDRLERADLEPEAEARAARRGAASTAAPAAPRAREARADESFEQQGDLDSGVARGHEDDLDLGRTANLGDAPTDEDELVSTWEISEAEEESLFPADDLEDEEDDEAVDEEAGLPEAEFVGHEPERREAEREAEREVEHAEGTEVEHEVETGVAHEVEAEVELIEDPEISAALTGLDDPGDVAAHELPHTPADTHDRAPEHRHTEVQELLPHQSPLDPPVRPWPDAADDAPRAETMALDALPFPDATSAEFVTEPASGAEGELTVEGELEDQAEISVEGELEGEAEISVEGELEDDASFTTRAEPIDGPLGPVHPASAPTTGGDPRLQQLIGAIAHEVRNPLVSIRTFSELLPDHYDDPEFRTHFRELVVKDVERIDRVIVRLQSLAERGGKTETVNVARLLDRLLDERRSTIQSRRLLVLKELDHASPLVYADPDQLEDALSGLLDRAIDQASERGDVYLASKYNAQGPEGHPTMRVLIRHSRASRGERPATGLGAAEMMLDLVLAERLLEVQGGRLTMDDAEANESVIVVDLPAP